jgi:hypothetical protein
MNNAVFFSITTQVLLFLELSDERTLDPDAAIELMEQIAASLHQLDANDKAMFIEYLNHRTNQAENTSERQALKNMAESLGLTST